MINKYLKVTLMAAFLASVAVQAQDAAKPADEAKSADSTKKAPKRKAVHFSQKRLDELKKKKTDGTLTDAETKELGRLENMATHTSSTHKKKPEVKPEPKP